MQGSLGLGMALIAAPILLLIDPRLVPGPFIVSILVVTVLMTWREWREASLTSIGWAFAGAVPGTVLGAWITATVATEAFGGVLGLLIVAAVVLTLLGHRVRPSRAALAVAGGASGFMASIVSIGGPPIALLLLDKPGGELRGTLAGYFTLSSLAVLVSLAAFGSFGRRELVLALPLLPAAAAGYALSGFITRNIDQETLRRGVLIVSGVAGLAIVFRYWG
ncbi:MAG: sulfite exporter TauE/SafE family protein [Gemmatimonadetes bacterium]|nr:sulfite exporter TauE/SafE family protein [Gemmatimonadota bacterium]